MKTKTLRQMLQPGRVELLPDGMEGRTRKELRKRRKTERQNRRVAR